MARYLRYLKGMRLFFLFTLFWVISAPLFADEVQREVVSNPSPPPSVSPSPKKADDETKKTEAVENLIDEINPSAPLHQEATSDTIQAPDEAKELVRAADPRETKWNRYESLKVKEILDSAARRAMKNPTPIEQEACAVAFDPRVDQDLTLSAAGHGPRRALYLNRIAPNLTDAFEIMATTEIGREVLTSFLAQMRTKQVRINELTEETQKHKGSRNPVEGFYSVNGSEIYANLRLELGMLSIALFHAMVHAIDGEFVDTPRRLEAYLNDLAEKAQTIMETAGKRVGKKTLGSLTDDDYSPEEKKQIKKLRRKYERTENVARFRAEANAYDAEAFFIRELAEVAPCLTKYLEAHLKMGSVSASESGDDIIQNTTPRKRAPGK